MTSIRRSTLAVALTVITLATTAFQCGGASSQGDLQRRVIRSVAAIPSIIRIVKPDLSPNILAVIDAGVGTFSDFQANPTADRWQLAMTAWNSRVRPQLHALNNDRVNQITAIVDILLTQVVVEPAPASAPGGGRGPTVGVTTKFEADDVRDLEKLTKP